MTPKQRARDNIQRVCRMARYRQIKITLWEVCPSRKYTIRHVKVLAFLVPRESLRLNNGRISPPMVVRLRIPMGFHVSINV